MVRVQWHAYQIGCSIWVCVCWRVVGGCCTPIQLTFGMFLCQNPMSMQQLRCLGLLPVVDHGLCDVLGRALVKALLLRGQHQEVDGISEEATAKQKTEHEKTHEKTAPAYQVHRDSKYPD